jgi:tetratricopeptide (TPR) repeat protein
MTELTDRITPEMSEEEVLGVILDEILERAEPDVAEAIRFCTVPHWFNEEIIAWLRGEGLKPSQRSREILVALTGLTFVGPYHERGWAYHKKVRDLLLCRWRGTGGEEFKELSGQAAGYFAHKLGEKEETLLARFFAAIRRVLGKVETLTEDEREEYRREQMYHFLAADPEQGFDLFRSMFNRARNFYQLSTCALLLKLAEEQEADLDSDDRLWLRFRQGQLAYVSAQWLEALTIFEGLWREELPSSLKGTLANDLGLLYRDKGEWERAIEYYERSLAIKEKVGDEHGMATTFNNLGEVYRVKGEWDRAIEYYEKDLAICKKVGDEHGMATTFNNLGSVYQDRGEWEQAIECYERSLAICEKVGNEHGMALSYNNIAMLYRDQGRLQEAIPLFGKSLEILERIGDRPHADTVRKNLEIAKQELEARKGQA